MSNLIHLDFKEQRSDFENIDTTANLDEENRIQSYGVKNIKTRMNSEKKVDEWLNKFFH